MQFSVGIWRTRRVGCGQRPGSPTLHSTQLDAARRRSLVAFRRVPRHGDRPSRVASLAYSISSINISRGSRTIMPNMLCNLACRNAPPQPLVELSCRCRQCRRVNGRSRGVVAVLSCMLAQDGRLLPSAYSLDRPCVCPRAFPCIRPRIRPRSADCASARLFPPAPTCTCRRRHGSDRGFCLSCWLSS